MISTSQIIAFHHLFTIFSQENQYFPPIFEGLKNKPPGVLIGGFSVLFEYLNVQIKNFKFQVPEMNQAVDKHMEKHTTKGLLVLLLQALGVLTGLIAMFCMARYGTDIKIGE